jgi:protein-L-isoaspartate(D-aspartate) O-methyltransferase
MDRIELAMSVIRRVDFLPEDQHAFAGQDRPISIGLGQTNSQPRTVAAMLELLDVAEGHRVLDVGAGSGWTTALLGQLVGPRGSVVGVELEPALAAWGAGNVARYGMDWVRLYPALAALGRPAQAPYDRILVSAAAQELKIGYVNSDRLTRDSVPAKAAQAKLEAEFSKREKELNEMATKLKAAADKLDKEGPTLPEAERGRRQRELVEQDRDLNR